MGITSAKVLCVCARARRSVDLHGPVLQKLVWLSATAKLAGWPAMRMRPSAMGALCWSSREPCWGHCTTHLLQASGGHKDSCHNEP